MAPAQPDLWQRCDEVLKDCFLTLHSLKLLVDKVKDSPPAKGKGLRWRAKAVIDLSVHGNDLASFREKIHKSNIALQTMLHTITVYVIISSVWNRHTPPVSLELAIRSCRSMLTHRSSSLSLKSNASQEQILFELEQLKYSFREALRVSSQPSGGFSRGRVEHPDARVSRNLHNLAAAARQFHSAASSTSGTTRAASSAQSQFIPPSSLIGDFPEHKRQRVEAFVQAIRHSSPEHVSTIRQPSLRTPSPSSSYRTASPPLREAPVVRTSVMPSSEPTQDVSEIDEDEEFEEEWEYFDGLRDLARDRIMKQDYTKAIEFLNQAMTKVGTWDMNVMDGVFMQLQVQLALCHFFKGDWKSAEPIVLGLATLTLNDVTCNLLHALSLAHLYEYSLDSALRFCRKALKGKKSILEKDQEPVGGPLEADYGNTLALCRTIYEMKGDPIRAEVFHRRLPKGFEYKHPSSELEYIFNHPRLLPAVLGNDIPKFETGRSEVELVNPESSFVFGWETVPQGAHKLYKSEIVANSPLRQRFARHELYESDTDKIFIEGPSPCSPCSPADSGIDMTADEERQGRPASGHALSEATAIDDRSCQELDSDDFEVRSEAVLNSIEGDPSTRLPFMTASTGTDASDASASDATRIGEGMVDGSAPAESPSESSRAARGKSPVRLPLRRRVTRMFNARRLRPTAAGPGMAAPLTCPPEPSESSRWWFNNSSKLGVSRSNTLLRNTSHDAGAQIEPKPKTRCGQRILRLGPMEVTFKSTARNTEARTKSIDIAKPTIIDEETCSEDSHHSGMSAAGPPSGQSKGRLGGLVTEYYGPAPSVGPYTCDEKRWPEPARRLPAAGNATMPHGPDDIVAAVELGSSGPVYSNDRALCSSEGAISRPEAKDQSPRTPQPSDATIGQAQTTDSPGSTERVIINPGTSWVAGKQRLRLNTAVKVEYPHDPARCRTELPGRLACVLNSLPTATGAEKRTGQMELEGLVYHIQTCLNDSLLVADLKRIIASLSNSKSLVAKEYVPYRPPIAIEGQGTSSPRPSSEPPLSSDSAPSTSAQYDLKSAARPITYEAIVSESFTPRHLFGRIDEANFKFVMPNDVVRSSARGTGPEMLIPSQSGPEAALCREQEPVQPDLQRAFSFVAGDDARYSCRGVVESTRRIEPDEETGDQDSLLVVSGNSPMRKNKQISWAGADSVALAVPNHEVVGGSDENKDEEKRDEQGRQWRDKTKGPHRSPRKSRFSFTSVSSWKRDMSKQGRP